MKQKNIKYANPLEFSSIEAIKKYVISGLGISVLPFYVVNSEIKNGMLKFIELEESFPKYVTQLIYHKNKKISAPMRKLIEITEENCSRWD